jgi:tellurite resistance protein TehA-like permease
VERVSLSPGHCIIATGAASLIAAEIPNWIDMGAMAISALVGTTLLSNSDEPFLAELIPFTKGLTILFWATATWWIPMLLILAVWRHVAKRLRFVYNPLYWGAVFPLGVYAVATYQLAEVTKLQFILWIQQGFTYIALTVRLATFAGMIRRLIAFRTDRGH